MQYQSQPTLIFQCSPNLSEEQLQQTATFFNPNQDPNADHHSPPESQKLSAGSHRPPPNPKAVLPFETYQKKGIVYKHPSKKTTDPNSQKSSPNSVRNPQKYNQSKQNEQLPINNYSFKPPSPQQQERLIRQFIVMYLKPRSPPILQGKKQFSPPIPRNNVEEEHQIEKNSSLQVEQQFASQQALKKTKSKNQLIKNSERFLQQALEQEKIQMKRFQVQRNLVEQTMKQIQEKLQQQPIANFQVEQEEKSVQGVQSEIVRKKEPRKVLEQRRSPEQAEKWQFPKINVIGLQTNNKNGMQQSSKFFKQGDFNQYGFSFRNIAVQDSQVMRKSKTAQETMREQEVQNKKSQYDMRQQESHSSLPAIQSPSQGTLQGFGQSKSGKSFLLRKPQAKIVSRLFSSKSDNN